ncbi:MAG: hypothetical protein HQ581_26990 [Planctomycetes bacterium]|nr:hypothetical protein [Planctomycetota bacterium]
MRRMLMSALAVAVVLGMSAPSWAQFEGLGGGEAKPLVRICLSGYDELVGDADYLGGLGGAAGVAKKIEDQINKATGGKGLAGFDKSKPLGVVISTDGLVGFPVVAFLPITDLSKLIEAMEASPLAASDEAKMVIGMLKPIAEAPAGKVVEANVPPMGPVYFKQDKKGGWLLVAQNKDDLESLPKDPVDALGGMHEKYDLAARVEIANIPPFFRNLLIDNLEMGADMGTEPMAGETDEEFKARKAVVERMIAQVKQAVNELEQITVGLAVDRSAGTAFLEFEMTAKEGTDLAAEAAEMKNTKTDFAGFLLPDAAMTAVAAGELSESDVAQLKNMVDTFRANAIKELESEGLSAAELAMTRQLLDDVFTVLEKTVDGGKLDFGMALKLEKGGSVVLAGGRLADGKRLDKVLKQIVGIVKKENPEAAKMIQLNAAKHNGVNLHVAKIPSSMIEDEAARQIVGDEIEIVVGIAKDRAYFAAGSNAVEALTEVIDASADQAGKNVAPMTMTIAAAPIARFIADIAPEPEVKEIAGKIAEILESSQGKDHLTITAKAIERGSSLRIEFEEGVMKAIATAAAQEADTMGRIPSKEKSETFPAEKF